MKQLSILLFSSLLSITSLQAQENVSELYNWTNPEITGSSLYDNAYNEVWGMVVNGREFAVMGSTLGTHIFDVTDPENTEEIFFIEGKDSGGHIIHRDYHDYKGYLYAVCDEGESSLQIIDISDLPNSAEVVYDSDELIIQSHNIFIDEKNDRMYSCGGKYTVNDVFTFSNLDVISLSNPTEPELISSFNSIAGAHDVYVRDNIVYLNSGSSGFHILDYTDADNPIVIGSLEDYPDKGYNHSGWLTNDGNTYIFADEDWGHDLKICDVSDPTDIEVIGTFSSEIDENSIPHNQIIVDDLLFISYYHDGLQVYDISNPENPEKVASYNTYLEDDHESYRGAWGIYPFLPSGNILVSDMQYGLYVLRLDDDLTSQLLDQTEEIIEPIQASPNPFSDHIVFFNDTSDDSTLEIHDLQGHLIHSSTLSPGSNRISLPINIASGIYTARIFNDTFYSTQKLIKTQR